MTQIQKLLGLFSGVMALSVSSMGYAMDLNEPQNTQHKPNNTQQIFVTRECLIGTLTKNGTIQLKTRKNIILNNPMDKFLNRMNHQVLVNPKQTYIEMHAKLLEFPNLSQEKKFQTLLNMAEKFLLEQGTLENTKNILFFLQNDQYEPKNTQPKCFINECLIGKPMKNGTIQLKTYQKTIRKNLMDIFLNQMHSAVYAYPLNVLKKMKQKLLKNPLLEYNVEFDYLFKLSKKYANQDFIDYLKTKNKKTE